MPFVGIAEKSFNFNLLGDFLAFIGLSGIHQNLHGVQGVEGSNPFTRKKLSSFFFLGLQ